MRFYATRNVKDEGVLERSIKVVATGCTKYLLTHEVSAISRKIVGNVGSSLAVRFPISLINAVFHYAGTPSKGQGADFLIAADIS